jgi:hypothetical protein
MKNTGKDFELAIYEIFGVLYRKYQDTTIEHDVYLDSPDGPRQFDVVIKVKIPDDELVIVIEGKDYNTKINITKLDGFHSKMSDVNASKGILISKKGFSPAAISKAKRLDISLYSLNHPDTFKEFDLKVPILIAEVSPSNLELEFNAQREKLIQLPEKVYFDQNITINNCNVFELINRTWSDGTLKFDLLAENQHIDIPQIKAPYSLRYFTNEKSNNVRFLEIEDLKLNLRIGFKYYICDIKDLLDDKALRKVGGDIHFFVSTNSLMTALNNLTPVTLDYVKTFRGIQYQIKVKNTATLKFSSMSMVQPEMP